MVATPHEAVLVMAAAVSVVVTHIFGTFDHDLMLDHIVDIVRRSPDYESEPHPKFGNDPSFMKWTAYMAERTLNSISPKGDDKYDSRRLMAIIGMMLGCVLGPLSKSMQDAALAWTIEIAKTTMKGKVTQEEMAESIKNFRSKLPN